MGDVTSHKRAVHLQPMAENVQHDEGQEDHVICVEPHAEQPQQPGRRQPDVRTSVQTSWWPSQIFSTNIVV